MPMLGRCSLRHTQRRVIAEFEKNKVSEIHVTGPTLVTMKRLFALSRNRCAFPDCPVPVVEASGTVTADICHIKAASPGGPRYDIDQPDAERHSALNLLLLCGRHHRVIDTESQTYTVAALHVMKRQHEQAGLVEISPFAAKAAQALMSTYAHVVVHANAGQIAVHSPGAIQANTINLKSVKTKLILSPPKGSIASDRSMLSYGKYLIDRYQQYQKSDSAKTGTFKYMAIYASLKREFKGDWKLMPQSGFADVIEFLHRRIDNTRQGRINKAKGYPNYHLLQEHL